MVSVRRMCGIVGYAGPQAASPQAPPSRPLDVVLQGLARLEYRGYDSAGIAVVDEQVRVTKRSGKLKNLREALEATDTDARQTTGAEQVADTGAGMAADTRARQAAGAGQVADAATKQALGTTHGGVAIGHTRWATHGAPTDTNAHPHRGGRDGELAVVHNGIIENFAQLRADLAADGFVFVSETDSEVAAHLLAREVEQTGDLTEAMRATTARLEGAFTLLAVHRDQPGTVVAARRNSPLVVGLGEGENFLGSDVAAFVDSTKEALEIDQDQIVTVTADSVRVIETDGTEVPDPKRFRIEWDVAAAQKGGYPSFMAKEIHEQAGALADTLLGRLVDGTLQLDERDIDESVLRSIDKIVVIACGTAANAGAVVKYAIEHWCRIPVEVELAHEFRYRDPVVTEKTLVVAISQSGETMDTLMAVRHAREQGAKVIAICNTRGSTIPREADAALYLYVGPEIAVASTKAYLGQIAACYLLGLYLAQVRGNLFPEEIA